MNGPTPHIVRPVEWRAVIRWAVVATVIQILLVAASLSASGGLVDVIAPGRGGPAEALIRQDFPDYEFQRDLGHDGQQYYAIAREPMHLDAIGESVPRTRYVAQRIAFPLAAWMLHPSGGGDGLVWAMAAVGALSVLGLAVATGALSSSLGGTPLLAAVAALLPGTNASLQVSTPDTMALALAIAAAVCVLHRRPWLAVAFGAIAILSKESIALAVLAALISLGGRRRWLLAVVATAPAVVWWVTLRVIATSRGPAVTEIVTPLTGYLASYRELWSTGNHLTAAAYSAVVLLAPAVLWLRRGHAMWWLIAAQLPLVWCLGLNSVGPEFNGSRILQPVVLLVIVALLSGPRHGAGGRPGNQDCHEGASIPEPAPAGTAR